MKMFLQMRTDINLLELLLRIEDFEGNVKKEYRKDGLYITDISVGSTLIQFNLSAKTEKALILSRIRTRS